MAKNRFLLGSVAFGVSFSISLLTSRDAGKAIATGLTTTVASLVAAVVVDRRSYGQVDARLATLKSHIYALQQRRAEAYQALVELDAEREQLAFSMSLQPRPLQLPSSAISHSSPRKALSWDLSDAAIAEPITHTIPLAVEVKPYELPTQVQLAKQSDRQSGETFAEAAATKRQIEVNLNSLQMELNQLKTQTAEQRLIRDKLTQELTDLNQQKQQLETKSTALVSEVQELENCRSELEQFLSFAEAKKRELETGVNPLQTALKQLQSQVTALQEELRLLDAQIVERRRQKTELEAQIASLDQHSQLEPGSSNPKTNPVSANQAPRSNGQSAKSGSNGNGSQPVRPPSSGNDTRKVANPHRGTTASAPVPATAIASTIAPVLQRPAAGAAVAAEKPGPLADLPNEWTEFMVQLPEYEFEVLRVIVEQNNPASLIKRIAEENLTMPELLIDSINERALDTIGDLVIESGSSSGTATIARDHLKAVKKLIKTYEYLTE